MSNPFEPERVSPFRPRPTDEAGNLVAPGGWCAPTPPHAVELPVCPLCEQDIRDGEVTRPTRLGEVHYRCQLQAAQMCAACGKEIIDGGHHRNTMLGTMHSSCHTAMGLDAPELVLTAAEAQAVGQTFLSALQSASTIRGGLRFPSPQERAALENMRQLRDEQFKARVPAVPRVLSKASTGLHVPNRGETDLHALAARLSGQPYTWNGGSPFGEGDCSGFMAHAARVAGGTLYAPSTPTRWQRIRHRIRMWRLNLHWMGWL